MDFDFQWKESRHEILKLNTIVLNYTVRCTGLYRLPNGVLIEVT